MPTEPSTDLDRPRFHCTFPECGARYQRKGHLNRHMAQHSQKDRLSCPYCESTVTRSDLLRRHIRIYHPQKGPYPSNRVQKACSSCHTRKERCTGGAPCNACQRRGISCSTDKEVPAGRTAEPEPTASLATETPCVTQDYIDIYFKLFHPAWPFLYCSRFDLATEPPILVQSIVMIVLWIDGDSTQKKTAVELHDKLCNAIHDQMDQWYISEPSTTWPMGTYQSILLQVIFALFQSQEGASFDLSLRFRLAPLPYKLLVALIKSCRRLEIFTYPKMLEQHGPGAPVALLWVALEEVKRFGLALYRACRMCCPQSADGGGRDPSGDLLTLADLNFCIPDSDEIWNATDDTASSELRQIAYRTWTRDNGDVEGWISQSWSVLHSAHFEFDWL